MGWLDYEGTVGEEKLDAIQHHHILNDARLKAVVEGFLLGEGEHQPSWRRLIHALHEAEQSHLAEKIETNAEPQQGEWVLVWRGELMFKLTQYHNVCILAHWEGSDCYVLVKLCTSCSLAWPAPSQERKSLVSICYVSVMPGVLPTMSSINV